MHILNSRQKHDKFAVIKLVPIKLFWTDKLTGPLECFQFRPLLLFVDVVEIPIICLRDVKIFAEINKYLHRKPCIKLNLNQKPRGFPSACISGLFVFPFVFSAL